MHEFVYIKVHLVIWLNQSLGLLLAPAHHSKARVFFVFLGLLCLHNLDISQLFFVCLKHTNVLIFGASTLINQKTPLFYCPAKIYVHFRTQVNSNEERIRKDVVLITKYCMNLLFFEHLGIRNYLEGAVINFFFMITYYNLY